MENNEYLLQMKDIKKRFPGVMALKGVDLNVGYGEIHALVGENGAGKSTLMKCLLGIYPPTSGEIYFDGKLIKNYNVAEALKIGISMIHQEISPILYRPIMENIWSGREPLTKFGLVDHKKMYESTKKLLEEIELDEDPMNIAANLTVAKLQLIEIAKAISYDAKLIIMDEPTSALPSKEVEGLFKIMKKLKSEGRSIIYISHKIDEIYAITDKVSVLRDGEYIGTEDTNKLSKDKLIKMMVGRNIDDMFPKTPCDIKDVYLEVKNLSHSRYFQDISFNVRKGEILGIAGLVGSGRTEIIESIFGIRNFDSGEIFINGEKVEIKSPIDAIDKKMAFLTEDRRQTGIFPMLDVEFNLTLANILKYVKKSKLIDYKNLKEDCNKFIDTISIKTPSPKHKIENLSGGNQQKVLVAKWLLTEPDILFLDEPTRGIDVGAKSEIHKLISMLASQGKCIVMVSSELPEIIGMSDRIIVVHEGKITSILDNNENITQELIMEYATDTYKERVN
ncbi:sugar ABC transporter ATP-binding protein [Paratissierella segnis]|uniref:Ribose/galactose/methyl galactoside import ATP-binding protein n=1 Tax=Paratissierella segnis TaxID=2763679 RepID=A0A926IK09_9FIRM|nr:sugar ABC transporter ATP-binding protein [Paratissierella segnis]MBC8587218.1 sugar ABC transporter ATP-binding protein [Paratissierella segnis]